jgi:hypothetical protein
MRGTLQVRSLVRLLLAAGFLCAAWLVLTSSHAQAAERPAPLVPAAADVLGGVSSADAGVPKRSAPSTEPHHGVVAAVAKVVEKPPVDAAAEVHDVAATTRSGVDLVTEVARSSSTAVPVLKEPVAHATDEVERVVAALPVVGREPVVQIPGAQAPVVLPGTPGQSPSSRFAEHGSQWGSTARQADSPIHDSVGPVANASSIERQTVSVGACARAAGHGPAAQGGSSTSGGPAPSVPWPPAPGQQPAPAPSTQPGAASGGTAGTDCASLGPSIFLPDHRELVRTREDVRAPHALPEHPATRPD